MEEDQIRSGNENKEGTCGGRGGWRCRSINFSAIWNCWPIKITVRHKSALNSAIEYHHTRAEERKGGETSQLALARCVMRGVLGRERSRARTVEKWRVKTKFCSIYKVHCYGWTVRHSSLPFGSGHLYTICKLWVVNNKIIVSQIKVNICEIY